jgi:uncharacterized protein YfaS (alpha-2-macroglobulin family)
MGKVTKLVFLFLFLGVMMTNPANGQSKVELWQKVNKATEEGLPQTALKHIDPIYNLAIKEKDYADAANALCKKIMLQSNIEGNSDEYKIKALEKALTTVPTEIQPLLKIILATWYNNYYNNNSYRFRNRTETTELDNDDFTTWDLPRLIGRINGLYDEVLKEENKLKKISINSLYGFIEGGNLPQNLRATVFDFYAHEALKFYKNDVQTSAKPQNAFEIDASSPAFSPTKDFIKWQPNSLDADSANLRAIKIYQRLLIIAQETKNQDALLDNDLDRLNWVFSVSVGEGKNEAYLSALLQLARANESNKYAATAYAQAASLCTIMEKNVEALKYAEIAEKLHPGSYGADFAKDIRLKVLAKEVNITAEKILMPKGSQILITYRNLDKLHFKLVKRGEETVVRERVYSIDEIDHLGHEFIANGKAHKSWTVPLKGSVDYKSQKFVLDMPQIDAGLYYIVASAEPNFMARPNAIFVAPIVVSNLGIIIHNSSQNKEAIVVDSFSGEPLKNISTELYFYNYNDGWVHTDTKVTDKDGRVDFPQDRKERFLLKARRGADLAYVSGYVGSVDYTFAGKHESRMQLFTDRAIYRPGQQLYFKGVAYSSDTGQHKYNILPNTRYVVELKDPNYKSVWNDSFTTNEFGSVHGVITLPVDRLTGRYTLETRAAGQTGLRHSVSIRVEEYKRPKFKVDLTPPEGEFKLNDLVTLSGTAMGYNGAPIDKAEITYRVKRTVRFPRWCWWIIPANVTAEIANGTGTTDNDGKFNISFKALPDRTVPEKNDPVFNYEVSVDVTDGNGETRTATSMVRVGYSALDLEINGPESLNAEEGFEIKVTSQTHNQMPISNKGTLKLISLKQPEKPIRKPYFEFNLEAKEQKSDPRNWEEDKILETLTYETSEAGYATCGFKGLKEGVYKVVGETNDKYRRAIKTESYITVVNGRAKRFGIMLPFYTKHTEGALRPGDTFELTWGTGYEGARVLVELEHRFKQLQFNWTSGKTNKETIKVPITEAMRGGFHMELSMVKENVLYQESFYVPVLWDNKDLKLSFTSMRSKLEPGTTDTWTVEITGKEAEKNAIEMLATMYDASLDAFVPHGFMEKLDVFYRNDSRMSYSYSNSSYGLPLWFNNYVNHNSYGRGAYPSLPYDIIVNYGGFRAVRSVGMGMRGGMVKEVNFAMAPKMSAKLEEVESLSLKSHAADGAGSVEHEETPVVDEAALGEVEARTNLNETAFFYPNLIMKDNHKINIEFTIPEALTTWKFLGFAHGKDLQSGSIVGTTITQKDFMVEPNAPRFLRGGDLIEFSAKLTNITDKALKGKVQLNLFDAASESLLNSQYQLNPTIEFNVPAKESRPVAWQIKVPDSPGIIKYRVVASTGNLNDGEEGYLPVLSRHIFITESLPLPIYGPATKNYQFKKLLESNKSSTLKHQGVTVEVTSNPAWYAVQALPYLMEYPYDCAEQIFSRIYANSLAAFIANSNPKIRRIIDAWREDEKQGGKALYSNLEKNEHLKSVALIETPWVLQGNNETERKHKLGILFEQNRLKSELSTAYSKLEKMQHNDGSYPWFSGGPASVYITLAITTGFGRLKQLNVPVKLDLAHKSLGYLDNWLKEHYDWLKKRGIDKRGTYVDSTIALYLYGRSFFLKSHPIGPRHKESYEFFVRQAKDNWLKVPYRMAQGHMALALLRMGDKAAANAIVKSLKERSVVDEEMGRFWRENEISFWWYRAEIETQAMMIEAFSEIANDVKAVEECQVWLIKQKQTQDWKSTKATADAIYSLILRGPDLLSSDKLVRMRVNSQLVEPGKVEAGTGYYQKLYSGSEVKAGMGNVQLIKEDKGVAWGAMHWQYFEDVAKVTPHYTNLKLKKDLFVKKDSPRGKVLEPVKDGKVRVGDLVVVRLELRTDRDMEYVHLKDNRGSGMEPVSVLSHYKYQDGLGYYESPKDTGNHFFIDYMPKGTYIFEYEVRVQHAGQYEMGIAEIQCMYAPEFNSHSQSILLNVTR